MIYDVIIVGGGIAGLTCSAYLAKAGKKVLLIEKNNETGGLVNSFNHNGFTFDAGVKSLLNAGIIFPMLKQLDINIETLKSPVTVGLENDILNIEKPEDIEKYKELLVKFYPESKKEVLRIIKKIKSIMRYFDILYGIDNPIFKDLNKDISFLFGKLLPWLPKFLFTIVNINRLKIPVENYLRKIVKNQSLMDNIIQHFFKNTPAFFALGYFSLYLNYFYPKGGIGKLALAIEKKVLENKGEIKINTKIIEIDTAKKAIKDEQGKIYNYKYLVWAADLKTFYKITKVNELSESIKKKFYLKKEKIFKYRGNDSVITTFIEVDEPVETFKKISYGHFFYTPSRKGLGELHRKKLDHILSNFDSYSKEEILIWLKDFLRYNTFEISIPVIRDIDLAPYGKTGLIVSFMAEYELFKKIKDAGWLNEFISEIEINLINILTDSIYPMLKDKIIAKFSFSPLSIESRVGSSEGAIVGWAFEREIPAVNNMLKVNSSILTPIDHIYQIGQWVYSPAGVPMSVLTGKIAADKIIKGKFYES